METDNYRKGTKKENCSLCEHGKKGWPYGANTWMCYEAVGRGYGTEQRAGKTKTCDYFKLKK
jgi:hypothetical protein